MWNVKMKDLTPTSTTSRSMSSIRFRTGSMCSVFRLCSGSISSTTVPYWPDCASVHTKAYCRSHGKQSVKRICGLMKQEGKSIWLCDWRDFQFGCGGRKNRKSARFKEAITGKRYFSYRPLQFVDRRPILQYPCDFRWPSLQIHILRLFRLANDWPL